MSQADAILDNSDYFYCQKARCTLRIAVCVQRQKANRKRRPFEPLPFPICKGCTQGAENKRIAKTGGGVPGEPRQGAGDRNIACPEYGNCLSLAAKKDWKTFNCEGCSKGQGKGKGKGPVKTEKKENTKLCDCGKTTLSPNCPYCPACMAERSNQARSAKKEPKATRPGGGSPKKQPTERPVEAPKEKKATQDTPKSEKAVVGPDPDTVLTIEFGKYSSILRQVEKLADEEMRPVDLQVIYMLKHGLDRSG